jgi:hypothetical protein
MTRRLLNLIPLLGAFLSLGAGSYRTPNFVVEAATPAIAKQVGDYAEHYRREKAMLWLGREMPQWPEPCPLRVTVTPGGSGGATSFAFDRGQVLGQNMHIEGTLERLLASVLPHEVTHTVFAFHFRQPVPRWADEGGSVLSEDEVERKRHDQLVRNILNNRRAMPLRRLLSLRDYPQDVMVLYAQGFSVCDFLVGKSSRPAFLNFVADGMSKGWDLAARTHYGFQNVEDLEQAWLQHLRDTKQRPPAEVAQGPTWRPSTSASPVSQEILVRQTAPPVPPLDGLRPSTARGAAPRPEDAPDQTFRPTGFVPSPPVTLGTPVPAPPMVRLGQPDFGSMPPGTIPPPASPPGWEQ